MRTLAVGDIHGCLNSLTTLMEVVKPEVDDRLVLLGDHIDRGPDSKGVIDWILETRKSMEIVTLLGNHEDMMLRSRKDRAMATNWNSFGGFEALASYGTTLSGDWIDAIPQAHWSFLEELLPFYQTENRIFVLGAVDGEKPMIDQDEGNLIWGRRFGITRHVSGKRVVCGHTPEEGGQIGCYSWGVCVDTGCCHGDWLSCLDVETGEYWQANERSETRMGRLDSI